MAAEGVSSSVIGEAVGLNRNRVDDWRRRYVEGGVDALGDRPRSGRPAVYGPQERLALVKTITTRPAEPGQLGGRRLRARMSMPEVARRLREDLGIAISDSQVWRICKSMGPKPWQVRSWMTSHDQDFDAKAVDVCGLYLSPRTTGRCSASTRRPGYRPRAARTPPGAARPAGGGGAGAARPTRVRVPAATAPWRCSPRASAPPQSPPPCPQTPPARRTSSRSSRPRVPGPRAPRAALHRRQPRHPRHPRRREVPRRPPPRLPAPHPHHASLAQPDRDMVLHPHPPTPRHRRVQPHQRPRRSHPRLHRRLQHPSPTLQWTYQATHNSHTTYAREH